MESIGGFFAKLSLGTDTASFQKGAKTLVELGKKATHLRTDFKGMAQDIISMSMKMAAAFIALGAAVAAAGLDVSGKMTALSGSAIEAGGMDPQKLLIWTRLAEAVGASKDSVIASFKELNAAQTELGLGKPEKLEAMAKNMALGFGITDFKQTILDANPDDRGALILGAFEKSLQGKTGDAWEKQYQLAMFALRDAGLSGFADLEVGARARKTTGLKEYIETNKRTSVADYKTAATVDLLKNRIGLDISNVGNNIGKYGAQAMVDPMAKMDKWFLDNADTLDKFAKALGDCLGALVQMTGGLLKLVFGDKSTFAGKYADDSLGSLFTEEGRAQQLRITAIGMGMPYSVMDNPTAATAEAMSIKYPGLFQSGLDSFLEPLGKMNDVQRSYTLQAMGGDVSAKNEGGRVIIHLKTDKGDKEYATTTKNLTDHGITINAQGKILATQMGPNK